MGGAVADAPAGDPPGSPVGILAVDDDEKNLHALGALLAGALAEHAGLPVTFYAAVALSLLACGYLALRLRAADVPDQPAVVAAGVERALRMMWQRWCAGLPAESFEVSSEDLHGTTPKSLP